jgi:membrane fusion protein, multidrug efflux system
VVAGLGACEVRSAPEKKDVVRPVKATVLGPASRQRRLTYSGVVRPRIESAVGFRVSGRILERFVNVGDRVEIGQATLP